MASSSKPFTNKSISIRLDETNYLLWRQQILFAIESLALASHIDGTISVPPQYTMVDGVKTVNAEFVVYKQQDSALCSWLLSSISTSILPSLVNCHTAFEIWEKVQKIFSVSSTTKIMHLHCSLKNLRKMDQNMREYLAQIHAVCDSLVACGNPLTETMHISAILSGLPSEYEPRPDNKRLIWLTLYKPKVLLWVLVLGFFKAQIILARIMFLIVLFQDMWVRSLLRVYSPVCRRGFKILDTSSSLQKAEFPIVLILELSIMLSDA
ncbi:hypothetical protein GQ457_01G011170 [Hibiscus cannabinus]